ncbi:MAG: plasmid recombination protein [Clostridia bacterium]|nr:plasmid recombination protein [Clostridia bacterium]
MDKYHRDAVIGIERENERDENYISKKNPQIDHARTPNNYHIIGRSETYLSYIDKRIKELAPKRKIKDDAVLINSFILGSDGEFFSGLSEEQQKEFFRDCAMCFAERYGEENIISAIVHMDETNPHMHLNLIPVLNGRLCSKQLFDRKALRELQTDFHEKVGKKWGLQRGKIGIKAEHLDTVAFKLKKMKEEAVTAIMQQNEAKATIAEAEQAQKAAKPVKALLEDYEKAKSDNIPFSGKKKDEQIIALRTKNEQLQREIEIRGHDQSDLFKQLQEAKKTDSRKETAYKIVTDMMSTYPDEFDALLQKSRKKENPPTPFKSNTNDKDGK